uniref:Uncharacterized protein n=1 Tax=Mesocestoides corti TaxID=53468 RepID=A0A5K3FWU0_MESCO
MDDESFLQVYKCKVPRQLFAWATILPDVGCGDCRTGYFINTGYQQQCKQPSQKLRTASFLRGRQCGVGLGRRHGGPLGLSKSVFFCVPMACGKGRQPTRVGEE